MRFYPKEGCSGMQGRLLRPLVAASVLMMIASACGNSDDGTDPGVDNGGSDSLASQLGSLGACEVLNDLEPLHEYMQIHEIRSPDGNYVSSSLGSGADAEALTCQGLVDVSQYYKEVQDEYEVNQGELRVGIVPLSTIEAAQESYAYRAVSEHEKRLSQGQEEIFRTDLGGDWDEGLVLALREGSFDSITAVGRDGEWLVHVFVQYNHDRYPSYFELNRDAGLLEGDPEDYVSYPFTTESLATWIAEVYMDQVHQQVSQRIGED